MDTDTMLVVSLYARHVFLVLALLVLLDFLFCALRSEWNRSALAYLVEFRFGGLPSPWKPVLASLLRTKSEPEPELEPEASTIFVDPYFVSPPGNIQSATDPTPSAPEWVSCHVCSSFAGLRCSRCRVARYCSGKCQIIHWKQGHKKECCTPTTLRKRNNVGSSTNQKITQNPGPSRQITSLEGNDTNSSEAVKLSDPDALICSICYEYLSIPVYQCENGHILCSLCSTKVKDFCPSCNLQSKYYRCRGIEKILESAEIVCPNKKYGCEKIIGWFDRSTHEKSCLFLPCCCPINNCNFSGTTSHLSAHVRREHNAIARFSYNQSFCAIFSREMEFRFLIEESNGDIFILYNQRRVDGNAFSLSVIGQRIMRERFVYKLKVKHGGYTQSIKVPADIVQSYKADHAPAQSLVVPDSYFNNFDAIELKLYVSTDAGKTPHTDSEPM